MLRGIELPWKNALIRNFGPFFCYRNFGITLEKSFDRKFLFDVAIATTNEIATVNASERNGK